MKRSTETANNAVNGDTLRSKTFGHIEKALYGLVCCLSCLVILTASGGCDLGTPRSGGGISNLLQSAPPLEEFDENNNYIPYKQTGEMTVPRYLHEGITHSGGLAFVFGGSDERGLSALDTIEFFDQSTLDEDAPVVESETGVWIDTDIEGNPIVMLEGPRILHSVTELSNGMFIIIGGTDNMTNGTPKSQAEKFDPNTRQSEAIEDPMEYPRFRHRVTKLPNGELLITGGQIQIDVTIENPGGQQGGGGIDQQEPRFPSTNIVEVFSPNSNEFDVLMARSSRPEPATLSGARGRSDHAVCRIAGMDNVYLGGDDLYVLTGGMETLSATSGFAPAEKFPGAVGRGEADGKTSIEVYDPGLGAFILISSVKLNSPRVNSPYAVNLGQFNNYTPDGVPGMGNGILITHGNSDGNCPETPLLDQVFIAYFQPGGGPANGLRFFEAKDEQYLTQIQHMEYPGPQAPARGDQISRCATNPVAMPRKIEDAIHPLTEKQTWIFSLAGADIFNTPNGCAYNLSSTAMLAGGVFDPFFNVGIALTNDEPPTSLGVERRRNPQNYLGIVGAWFTIDSDVGRDMTAWGTSPQTRWPENRGFERSYVTCLKVGGVNGILGDYDDRILLAGGGRSYNNVGGEPTSPSAEIFLPPGVSQYNED